jgi:predicted nucleic acid-binding protein
MKYDKAIVVDANIIIRAILGTTVRNIIVSHAEKTAFYTSSLSIEEVHKHLPKLFEKRGQDPSKAMDLLNSLSGFISEVPTELLLQLKNKALQRIAIRDADDWHIVATALLIDCPIWTEDTDFFGAGIPIWTTDRVQLFLTDD